MTYPVVDHPWLWQWWDSIRSSRNAAPPWCWVCGATGTLVLTYLGTATGGAVQFKDLTALCPPCADRTEQLVADRCAPGQRWETMPRMIAIRTVLSELATGRISRDADHQGEPVW